MRIGELAALAGVSTRTVRHYHHLGLLPEPGRRANGYRVYELRDAVRLARIRRLTELGLGLDEVRDVLADDAGRELREVLEELDADLARQEAAIRARRERLGVLLRQAREGGGLPPEGPVSPELGALFEEMARVSAALPGPEPSTAAMDREVLALLETTGSGPEERRRLSQFVREMAAAPQAAERAYEMYALLDELADADPADPRVELAAQALAGCLPREAISELTAAGGPLGEGAGAAAGGPSEGFLDAIFESLGPARAAALRRAMTLLTERKERT
ncbi:MULTISPECIES: MerR family transcriptional regulator [Streptomyces]|uniref:MerR family transcriptional regulator n=2 Tax=Streptomyces TaxID=1883 RepID=A0A3R7LS05_9ACTN|nr:MULTISPECIES: MerR family transcriptional regulator [Streptomyces]KNE80868.1 MerR family transcriptional regulator [Streptomyces fradiae]OFA55938.1 MerR family transcriptional regulator [Streptomyces fradiae]PQM24964.1 MerR family transcriptional regulator [Streptomyces xinghaiensis]RKM99015.1 MerR family transcriptional regulator [Streptomyces xinghaiensis]RNC76082.1 MerR family transcriptional regulator [Streptomyces xinghaiensis]